MSEIKFGTSGWRAIIAEDFTFQNVRLATAAIAEFVKRALPQPRLIVGYDTRFLAEKFAWESAEVLSGLGVQAYYCRSATPTPAIAAEVLRRKTDGAINITASHNPGEYCGLKFSSSDGAPALPEITRQLEQLIESLKATPRLYNSVRPQHELIERIDITAEYLGLMENIVDLKSIRQSGVKVGYDPLYGTGVGYLDGLLSSSGIPVHTIHDRRDVLFGGHPPEPAEDILADLKALVSHGQADLGLSTDGDADRFGILDRSGDYIPPNQILGLLFDYLIETRGWKGGAARSVATSHFVDAVARFHQRELHETPVGFKYIGELIKADKIVIGGEESAGLTIKGHVPEKDGILACLLAAEAVARRGKSLRQQLDELQQKVGFFFTVRLNLHLTEELKEKVRVRLESPPKQLGGRTVVRLNRLDGLKMMFEDDSWILLRLSGTEPVARCYVETHSQQELERLTQVAKEFVLND
ncbi:MAG: phosphoglucomutase/phosphomannomutase family protein [Acidobacteriota bacterium]